MGFGSITSLLSIQAARGVTHPIGTAVLILAAIHQSEDENNVTRVPKLNHTDSSGPLFNISKTGAPVTKNLNVYWIATTLLALWFLFVHAPPIIVRRKVFLKDPPFALHLVGAYTIYLGCVHNALITPSINKSTHVWMGRIGMIGGIIGVVFGAYCSWWPTRWELVDRGFAVAITIGGVFQILAQVGGYKAIRRFQSLSSEIKELKEQNAVVPTSLEEEKQTALKTHIGCMLGLFVCACGIPAAIRLVEVSIPSEQYFVLGIVIVVVILNVLTGFYGDTFFNKVDSNARESETVDSETPLMTEGM